LQLDSGTSDFNAGQSGIYATGSEGEAGKETKGGSATEKDSPKREGRKRTKTSEPPAKLKSKEVGKDT